MIALLLDKGNARHTGDYRSSLVCSKHFSLGIHPTGASSCGLHGCFLSCFHFSLTFKLGHVTSQGPKVSVLIMLKYFKRRIQTQKLLSSGNWVLGVKAIRTFLIQIQFNHPFNRLLPFSFKDFGKLFGHTKSHDLIG